VKIPRPDFDLNSLERSSTRHQALSVWDSDEVSIAAIALFALGVLVWYNGYAGEAQGELRCEGGGPLSSMLTARTMRSTAWRVGATLQLSRSGTVPLAQKHI
jgi:hypothetical protein